MAKPKKRKLRVRQKTRVRKKSEEKKDTIPRMQAQPPRNNGAVMKIKIKRR